MFRMSPTKRNRLLLWAALALLISGMIWAARKVLLPYIVGLVLAYLLLPVVNWLDRHMPAKLHGWRVARPMSIILTYLLLLILVAGIVAFFVPIIVDQVQILTDNWPSLVNRVEDWGQRGLGWYTDTIPQDWRTTIETNLKGLLDDIATALKNGLVATTSTVFSTISYVIGLIVIPFWLFSILNDESQVTAGVIHALPQQLRADVQCLARLIDDVLRA
jgi:predicted PurR-regulated permease PerM